ncbi:MAG: hypothetical protein ACRDSR_26665 [Pseudonocardiaceae bacterium]
MSDTVKGTGVVRRALAATAVAMAAVGVVLAVLATRVSEELEKQRHNTCDGLLPMPASGFWFGWLGAGLAVAALVLAVVQLVRHGRSVLSQLAAGCAMFACLFAVFVLYTLFQDAEPIRWLCSG